MDVVADLALTPDRRSRLSAFLTDHQLLRAEYPAVADYLNTASGLPGSGDDEADAAFDLRFLHYVTGGRSASTNPYWDIIEPSVFERDGNRAVTGGAPDGSAQLAFAQMALQATYAYAIPSPETIDWVARICGGRPLLEVGAGRGYWAAQLALAGLTVEAYELAPPDAVENVSFPRAKGQADVWYTVNDVKELRFDDLSDAVLFLCWPPGWGNSMASDVLSAFESAGGSQLIYIGEPKGGKTANDAFFDALSAHWCLESEDPHFVSWWNLTDRAQALVRQRRGLDQR